MGLAFNKWDNSSQILNGELRLSMSSSGAWAAPAGSFAMARATRDGATGRGIRLSGEAGEAFTSAFGTALLSAAAVSAVLGVVMFGLSRRPGARSTPTYSDQDEAVTPS